MASTRFINSIEGQIIYEKLESSNVNGKNFIFNQTHKIVNNEGGILRVYIRFYEKEIGEDFTMQIQVVDLFLINGIILEFTNVDDLQNFRMEVLEGIKENLYLNTLSDIRHLFFE